MNEEEEFEFRHRLEQEQPAKEPFSAKGLVRDLAAGAIRGAGSIGSTLIEAGRIGPKGLGGQPIETTLDRRKERTEAIDETLAGAGANPESLAYKGGKVGAEIAGTMGVGGALANVLGRVPAIASAAPNVLNAIRTSGMAGTNMLARMTGGAITGGASAGLVNPEDAATGAAIGGLLPPAVKLAGEAGKAVGRAISGPAVPEGKQAAIKAAQEAGLVIPPSQAKPTLVNRAMEGFAGKITTAQNASAKNQPVFNDLAKSAIGAADLSPEGISAVRKSANSAYDQLAQVGTFQADDAFKAGVRKTAALTDALKKDFPELVNADVEKLVEGISGRAAFDAQGTIEAIKRLRFDGSANRIAQDPGKKALGKAQMGIANELENLVDRNLEKLGEPELLDAYRQARTTLAKSYDIEKAINPATLNVDANKLAQINKKSPGRLTGELKTIAEFAGTFPKAAQAVEKMGSLPQVSPLDFGALGIVSAATANPLMMAGVAARPLARYGTLSPMVQSRLGASGQGISVNPLLLESLYKTAPVIGAQR